MKTKTASFPVARAWLGALILLTACEGDPSTAGSGGGAATTGASTAAGTGAAQCPTSYDECDGDLTTVCETSIRSDVAHCGGCDEACPAGAAHQRALCAEGSCEVACEDEFKDCDRDPANGCETPGGVGACELVNIVPAVEWPNGLSVDDTYIYYGTHGHANLGDGTISRARKDGTGTPQLLADTQELPLNLTIDDTHVYWDDRGHAATADGKVFARIKDGSTPAYVIADMQYGPANVVVDDTYIYWTTQAPGAGTIQRAPKDGSGMLATTLVVGGVIGPRDLQLYKGALYWASAGLIPDAPPRVGRWKLPDGPEEILESGISSASFHIAIDTKFVYLGSFDTGFVLRVPTAGGPAMELAALPGTPQEIVVDDLTHLLYVTTGVGARVFSVGGNSGEVTIMADHQISPTYLTQDELSIYWADGAANAVGAIRSIPKL